jgi:hypothetical protein
MKKHTLLIVLFLINFSLWSKENLSNKIVATNFEVFVTDPVMPTLLDLQNCGNGTATFDLTVQNATIFAAQSNPSSSYTITYYTDASNTSNIVNPTSYVNMSNPQTIYVRITNNNTLQYAVGYFSIIVNPLPNLTLPANFAICDSDGVNDGYYLYSLDSLIPTILGTQFASNFTVYFYENQADANSGSNPIANPATYLTYSHNIWIRVENNTTHCFRIGSFQTIIEQLPSPFISTSSSIVCVDFNTNNVINPLVLNAFDETTYLFNPLYPIPSYSYQWYLNGIAIAGATGSSYVDNTASLTPRSYTVQMTNTSYGCSYSSNALIVHQSGPAAPIGLGYSIVNNGGIQTLTVEIQGYGVYEYSLDANPRQTSPVFTNVPIGIHTITVWDVTNGINSSCDPIIIDNIDVNNNLVPVPTGSMTQTLPQGSTLADVVVTGQNIRWYATATNKSTLSTPLPLSTVLVDGTTYFASQTIGGYESTDRLPVTINLVLKNEVFNIEGLTFSPNPVVSELNIKANETISKIAIYNILGQVVLLQNVESSNFKIDLSKLNSGNYIVKAITENKQAIFKIVKE